MTGIRLKPIALAVLLLFGGMVASPPAFCQDGGAPAPEVPSEPDYAKVADDARKIADEIGERLIESHMVDAREGLGASDGATGHLKSEEAYVDMEEMIAFCESTSAGAGSACKFKLKIKMSLKPGNTLGQLGKGMNPGTGLYGTVGQGASGQSGSAAQFGIFGPDSFGKESRASRFLSERKRNAKSLNDEPGSLATSVEELTTSKKNDIDFNAEGESRIMEEYRTLIEAYFKRLAEEDNGL